jgi:hypothetical protein
MGLFMTLIEILSMHHRLLVCGCVTDCCNQPSRLSSCTQLLMYLCCGCCTTLNAGAHVQVSGWTHSLLKDNGAQVQYEVHGGGHEVGPPDVMAKIAAFLGEFAALPQAD